MNFLDKIVYKNDITERLLPIDIDETGIIIKITSKTIAVNGVKTIVDPRELIRIIKYITQTIGEYKNQGGLYSNYAVPALRKSRSLVVADLEKHFGITWRLDEQTNNSQFFALAR